MQANSVRHFSSWELLLGERWDLAGQRLGLHCKGSRAAQKRAAGCHHSHHSVLPPLPPGAGGAFQALLLQEVGLPDSEG